MVQFDDLSSLIMSILAAIASDTTLDDAFIWLCKRRHNYPDHAMSEISAAIGQPSIT